ncbi:MAG: DNA recombination protein RmuC [Chitinophagales bacterium]
MEILYLLIGLLAGAAVAYFFLKSKSEGELGAAREKAQLLEQTITEVKNELRLASERAEALLREERSKSETLGHELATTRAEANNLHQRLLEQKAELEDLNQRFTKEFENLANRILDEKGKKFSEQNESQIKNILDPLRHRLNEFEQKIQQNHVEQEKERSALKEQLRTLTDMNKRMSDEAINLTRALKGEAKTQGNWGELILEKILEKSGLRKGTEYDVQPTFVNEDGSRLQPDVVIHLPEGKNLIVDSKVSLVAYERYNSAELKEEQDRYMREHILSLRNHVKGLSGKNYQNLYQIGSPDFVLLFVPIEPAFSLAVGNDDNLYHEAFEKNIIIVSTSTLLATLRTINNIWKQERQNRHVLEIARQSGELYDKFAAVVDDFIKLGVKMEEGKKTYEEAMGRLYKGKGNVIARFENLKTLGAKASKSINPKILERTDDVGDEKIEQ